MLLEILLCLSSLTLAGGQIFTSQQDQDLDTLVNTLLECRGVPGLTMAVVKGNETWTRGFGVADKETGRRVTNSTLFGIGSVTKAFTSAILAMLIDDGKGKFSWSSRLTDVFGKDLRMADEELTRHVTIKDLLTHRTGLVTSNVPLFAALPPGLTREEYSKRIRYLPVAAPFRDAFAYNNWMYTLAGRAVEVMGGASWEELLSTRVLQPLGMTQTRVIGRNVQVNDSNFALPYIQVGEEVVSSDPSIYTITPQEPAGAMASSADDMAKWMQLLINKGKTPEGEVVLNETRLTEMHSMHMALTEAEVRRFSFTSRPDFPVTFASAGYGYAWFYGMYRGYQVIWHSGGLYAYTTYLHLIPALNISIFTSVNGPGTRNASNTEIQLFLYTADLLMGYEPWINLTNACNYPAPWSPPRPPTPRNETIVSDKFDKPEIFIGDYGNRLFGDVHVLPNGTDGLEVVYSRLTGKLFKTEVETVLLFEVLGSLQFLSAGSNFTNYMNFTFTKPGNDGKYEELEISAPDLGQADIITYQRGVKFSDPENEAASGQKRNSLSHFVLVFVPVSLFWILYREH